MPQILDVRVLNPVHRDEKIINLTKKDLHDVDLFTDVQVPIQGGPPQLIVGCKWNGLWIPIELREPSRWWDRLHYIPSRFLIKKPVALHEKKYLFNQNESNDRLTTLPRRKRAPAIIPQTSPKRTTDRWWDRLHSLPQRKLNNRQEIFYKYQDMLKYLTQTTPVVKKTIKRDKNGKLVAEQQIEIKISSHFDEKHTGTLQGNYNPILETQAVEDISDLIDIIKLELDQSSKTLNPSTSNSFQIIKKGSLTETHVSRSDKKFMTHNDTIISSESEYTETISEISTFEEISESTTAETTISEAQTQYTIGMETASVTDSMSSDSMSSAPLGDERSVLQLQAATQNLEASDEVTYLNNKTGLTYGTDSNDSTDLDDDETDSNYNNAIDKNLTDIECENEQIDILGKVDENKSHLGTSSESPVSFTSTFTEQMPDTESFESEQQQDSSIPEELVNIIDEIITENSEINTDGELGTHKLNVTPVVPQPTRATTISAQSTETTSPTDFNEQTKLKPAVLGPQAPVQPVKRRIPRRRRRHIKYEHGWWDRLSKPKKANYGELTPIKRKKRRAARKICSEDWVERLSKPRTRRDSESYKPTPLEINKRSRLLLRMQKADRGKTWWDRLSKPSKHR